MSIKLSHCKQGLNDPEYLEKNISGKKESRFMRLFHRFLCVIGGIMKGSGNTSIVKDRSLILTQTVDSTSTPLSSSRVVYCGYCSQRGFYNPIPAASLMKHVQEKHKSVYEKEADSISETVNP